MVLQAIFATVDAESKNTQMIAARTASNLVLCDQVGLLTMPMTMITISMKIFTSAHAAAMREQPLIRCTEPLPGTESGCRGGCLEGTGDRNALRGAGCVHALPGGHILRGHRPLPILPGPHCSVWVAVLHCVCACLLRNVTLWRFIGFNLYYLSSSQIDPADVADDLRCHVQSRDARHRTESAVFARLECRVESAVAE